ncbi:MAG: Jag N-terminal domain-containing protein [Thermodesulfobacteriota bacterium]|nr:Jag N-terminal domain-containing protein [Thermodesulfobacteriota bacterium]
MSSGKRDFYGKEVMDAIKKACDTLQAPQEELAIEVVETGSMGIFGLIRKKAHIRAVVKGVGLDGMGDKPEKTVEVSPELPDIEEKAEKIEKEQTPAPVDETREKPKIKEEKKKQSVPAKAPVEIKAESVELVRQQLEELLQHMKFPSEVTADLDGGTVRCKIGEEHEEALTGQEGKIIDSLQYILRKLVARKVEEKVRLSIDIGQFREKRKVELVERAKELAALVKEDGKTQAIPPLNPSERRVVHVALQDDKDIRSRSVGDGLFKKILIYKPGKGKKPGGNKRGGRGRRGKPSKKPQENSDS